MDIVAILNDIIREGLVPGDQYDPSAGEEADRITVSLITGQYHGDLYNLEYSQNGGGWELVWEGDTIDVVIGDWIKFRAYMYNDDTTHHTFATDSMFRKPGTIAPDWESPIHYGSGINIGPEDGDYGTSPEYTIDVAGTYAFSMVLRFID